MNVTLVIKITDSVHNFCLFFLKTLASPTHLGVVVVGSAVLLLHVFSSGCEEGQGVEVLMGGLLPTGHQFPIVE